VPRAAGTPGERQLEKEPVASVYQPPPALPGRDREIRTALEAVFWLTQVTLGKLEKDGPYGG
jgi:hypothetical protein